MNDPIGHRVDARGGRFLFSRPSRRSWQRRTMQSRENDVLTALLGAQRILTENEAQLTRTVDFTAARRRLDHIIESFSSHAVDQDISGRSARNESEKQRELLLALRTQYMAPIAEIARRKLRNVPEFKALHMPRRSTWAAFLGSAHAMADAASIYKGVLLDRGLPPDFLDRFQQLLAKLEDSLDQRDTIRIKRRAATSGLHFAAGEGRSLLKVLDALVRRALAEN
jgi:hypothetical protein